MERTVMPGFWDYSLRFHARDGVAAACIALQDACGADVNLLLFALWAARCGRGFGGPELEAVEAIARPWREAVTRPLRAARRAAKTPIDPTARAGAAFYDRMKRVEREAERLQQDAMAAVPLPASEAPPSVLARENLATCAAGLEVGLDGLHVETLLRAFAADREGPAEAALPAMPRKRLIVGISGASGAIYGIRLLELLRAAGIETHLVISRSAQITMAQETLFRAGDVAALADVTYRPRDIAAAIASGSFRTAGMIVAPCSMRSLSEIASGTTASLLTRAADVVLKERRRLVLLVRETPLHLGHLRSMAAATEIGAVIYPPVPAFYARPDDLQAMIDHTLGRVLDLFDIDAGTVVRWGEPTEAPKRA